MSETIRYEHVDISYKGELAVHDASFSVEEGEILGIVGESGSGKSTLIKAAMGLLGRDGLVTRGDIWYQGLDLPDLKPKEMRKICGPEIGMIFQMAGSSFCPIRTVRAQLYEIVKEHDLWLVADEVYREFIYEGLQYTSFGNVKEIEDRCVIIDSVSKRYSACGARIGSIACKNAELMGEIMKLCQGRLCIATLEQLGAAALFNETPASYLKAVNEEYCKRRDTLYNELMKVDGVICEKPMGAFYIVAKLPVDNAEDFVKWMLQEFRMDGATVMATPAEGFYATPGLGRDEIRLAYILKEEDLKVAGKLLAEGLKAYKTAMANA